MVFESWCLVWVSVAVLELWSDGSGGGGCGYGGGVAVWGLRLVAE